MSELNLSNPVKLLAQLQSGEFDDALRKPVMTGGQKSHVAALAMFFVSKSHDDVRCWVACIREMLFHASATDSAGGLTVFMLFSQPTHHDESVVDEVYRLYRAAGVVDVAMPYPGEIALDEKGVSPGRPAGLLPLAHAVLSGNSALTRTLLARGASLDVGPLFRGGPVWGALELAHKGEFAETASVVADFIMRQRLNEERALPKSLLDSAPVPDSSESTTFPQSRPARRRMGV
jgi:hypothetical protein